LWPTAPWLDGAGTDKGFLNGVQHRAARERFHRFDDVAVGLGSQQNIGAGQLAVEQNRCRAGLAGVGAKAY
jgi:hypothetical protein